MTALRASLDVRLEWNGAAQCRARAVRARHDLALELELLREAHAEGAWLRHHRVRLGAAGLDLAFGEARQFRALVERILQEEVQRPVAFPEADRQIGQRVGR